MNSRMLSAAMIGSSLLITSAVRASLTTVEENHNEATIPQILTSVYGGQFVASGDDFSNGSLSAVRVDDSADQSWTAQPYVATLVAGYSSADQEFGTFSDTGEFQSLISHQGFGSVDSAPVPLLLAPGYTWGHGGTLGTQSSTDHANADSRDHLVTYQIDGLGNTQPVWMLFWEDLDLTPAITPGRSSADFNDMVLTLQAAPVGGPLSVPLPPAALSGAVTVLGIGLTVLARKRRA